MSDIKDIKDIKEALGRIEKNLEIFRKVVSGEIEIID